MKSNEEISYNYLKNVLSNWGDWSKHHKKLVESLDCILKSYSICKNFTSKTFVFIDSIFYDFHFFDNVNRFEYDGDFYILYHPDNSYIKISIKDMFLKEVY